jgi:hypothetical protein
MPRRRSATLQFNAIRLVGGLLPASLIEQIATPRLGAQALDSSKMRRASGRVAMSRATTAPSATVAAGHRHRDLRPMGAGTIEHIPAGLEIQHRRDSNANRCRKRRTQGRG